MFWLGENRKVLYLIGTKPCKKCHIKDLPIQPIALEQVEQLTGQRPKVAIADMGYRGRKQIEGTQVVTPYTNKPKNNYQKRKAKQQSRRRAGIEPIIGHLKPDHRMARNFPKVHRVIRSTH